MGEGSEVPLYVLKGRLEGRGCSSHLDSAYRFSLHRKNDMEDGGRILLSNGARVWLEWTFRETQKLP